MTKLRSWACDATSRGRSETDDLCLLEGCLVQVMHLLLGGGQAAQLAGLQPAGDWEGAAEYAGQCSDSVS